MFTAFKTISNLEFVSGSKHRCKMCGCINCSSKSPLSRCSDCIRNIRKGAGATLNTRILSPLVNCSKSIKGLCRRSPSPKRKDKQEVCFCEANENAITMCIVENTDVGICTKNDVLKTGKNNCQCGQCVKFSEDGSCSCSHCLGVNDKSFDTKTSSKEIGTQCICADEKNENETYPSNDLDASHETADISEKSHDDTAFKTANISDRSVHNEET